MAMTDEERRAKNAERARARRARLAAEKAATESGPKHPEVQINPEKAKTAYVLASRTRQALRAAGVSNAECRDFFSEALKDPEDTLSVVRRWVTVTK